MATDCSEQLTFWNLGKQQISAAFDGGSIVTDAGLLPLRELDKELNILSELAARFPDPRAQKFVTHTREAILTQQVYQILADNADCNDANRLRNDPLFQTLVGLSPDSESSDLTGALVESASPSDEDSSNL